jgi:quercetin dioxygenase-like cupin family protein
MSDTEAPTPDRPITRTLLANAQLPDTKQVSRVEIRRIRILPGHAAGVHVHNGPVVGSIVEGSVAYQIDGEAASVLEAGDVFYEPEGVRILRFDPGADGVTFLAYFPLGPGQEAAIEMVDDG